MADVPAWVLFVNTVAVGGFGVLQTLIVPKAQRFARAAEKEEKAHAVMRDKAEQIFREINIARQIGNAALAKGYAMLKNKNTDDGMYDLSVFRALDAVSGLIATYYPDGLSIIRQGRAAMRKNTESINADLMAVNDPNSDENRAIRVRMALAITEETAKILDLVERHMMTAVAPYVPTQKPTVVA